MTSHAPSADRPLADRLADLDVPLPDDERERLDALAAVGADDLAVEDSLSVLTDVLVERFDVAVAFVGLVGAEEETFLASTGADWAPLAREDTVCTYSLLEDGVTVVEDVRRDERFADVAALDRLGVVSYAGADVTAPDGHAVGQLCLVDDAPRAYDDAERAELTKYADAASEMLARRRHLLDVADGRL